MRETHDLILPTGARHGEDNTEENKGLRLIDSDCEGDQDYSLRLYTNGHEAFADMVEDFWHAQKSIDIQMYSLGNDSTARALANALLAQKRFNPGVNVDVRIDRMGTFLDGCRKELLEHGSKLFTMLEAFFRLAQYDYFSMGRISGLQKDFSDFYRMGVDEQNEMDDFCRKFFTDERLFSLHPVARHLAQAGILKVGKALMTDMDHSKKVRIDGNILWTGGMNFVDASSGGFDFENGWHGKAPEYHRDFMVRIDTSGKENGAEIVNGGRGHTDERQGIEERALKNLFFLKNKGARRDIPEYSPLDKQLTNAVYRLIDQAKEEIRLEHAYVMDPTVIHKIRKKAHEGVGIRVTRGAPETPQLEMENEKGFSKIQGMSGVDVRRIGKKIHSKVMQVDKRFALISSANLSRLSMEYTGESGVLIVGNEDFQARLGSAMDEVE